MLGRSARVSDLMGVRSDGEEIMIYALHGWYAWVEPEAGHRAQRLRYWHWILDTGRAGPFSRCHRLCRAELVIPDCLCDGLTE